MITPTTMMAIEEKVECTRCGEILDDEQAASPRLDWDCDDGIICDQCYSDNYEFECCLCCEYGDIADMHNLVVVFDDDLEVPPGVYATEGCYYTQGLIGSSWLHPHNLRRLDDVPDKTDGEGYPCGHLCGHCQRKYTVHHEWGNPERCKAEVFRAEK